MSGLTLSRADIRGRILGFGASKKGEKTAQIYGQKPAFKFRLIFGPPKTPPKHPPLGGGRFGGFWGGRKMPKLA